MNERINLVLTDGLDTWNITIDDKTVEVTCKPDASENFKRICRILGSWVSINYPETPAPQLGIPSHTSVHDLRHDQHEKYKPAPNAPKESETWCSTCMNDQAVGYKLACLSCGWEPPGDYRTPPSMYKATKEPAPNVPLSNPKRVVDVSAQSTSLDDLSEAVNAGDLRTCTETVCSQNVNEVCMSSTCWYDCEFGAKKEVPTKEPAPNAPKESETWCSTCMNDQAVGYKLACLSCGWEPPGDYRTPPSMYKATKEPATKAVNDFLNGNKGIVLPDGRTAFVEKDKKEGDE